MTVLTDTDIDVDFSVDHEIDPGFNVDPVQDIREATYTDPMGNEKDRIRFLIGDVNMDRPLLTDSEIQVAIDVYSEPRRMGILYRTMANRLALIGKRSLGPQSEDYTDTIDRLNRLADQCDQAASCPTFNLNSSLRSKPSFYKGMHDNV